MKRDDPRHGTYAGYMTHVREQKRACKPCRLACNAYMRQYREDPEHKARESRRNNARTRAAWRLVALHRAEFARLYLIELGQPEMDETA